jgi:hypothetical protein
MRYEGAWRLTHRGFWLLALMAAGALLDPAWKDWALSFLVGLLLGLMNVRLLSSALRRGVTMRSGAAGAALSMAGVLRLVLVIAVLAWLVSRGRQIGAWPLMGGFFVPEAGFVGALLWLREPFDPNPGHEGDAA